MTKKYREHKIPLGSLVEILDNETWHSSEGVRMYVILRNHDCDGTPLYCLSYTNNIKHADYDRIGGFAEEDLKIIK